MAQTAFSIRMDEGLKRDFSQFCENIGMTMSTAFVVFAKAALRNRKIPFEIYDYNPSDVYAKKATVSGNRALEAFEKLRSQAQEQLKGESEPTLDDINAMIAEVRKERRERKASQLESSELAV